MALRPLPIDVLVPEIVAALAHHGGAVVVAPPGAGKTTRLAPALAKAPFLPRGIVLLQPRRVAARAAAVRIAEEQNWQVGEQVGYHIRFDNRTGPRTRVHVVTEGILARRIQGDPFLEDVSCVILDEFHERSIHTDLALALVREIQSTVRPDLRVVVMSATMDPQPVAAFLGGVPVFESAGRMFPVEVTYLERSNSAPVWDRATNAVRLSVQRNDCGHVLVFLPGIGEIRRTASLLEDCVDEVFVLHSAVSGDEQDRALRPREQRKIVLATNIAETSLTVDGVRTVIDSGLVRVPVNDPQLGIDRLQLQRVSLASAQQRAGRAGRTAAGRCLRLWTVAEHGQLETCEVPEVLRIDLAGTVLLLRAYGVRDVERFGWFQVPPASALARADHLLALLGAVDSQKNLTDLGRRLAGLPLHPRIGRLLLAGYDAGVVWEAATVAALLSERDACTRPLYETAPWDGRSDVLERLDALQTGRTGGLDLQTVASITRTRDDLLRLLGVRATPSLGGRRQEQVLLRVLLHAYPDRVTARRASDPTRGVLVGGRGVVLAQCSVVRQSAFFLSLDPRETTQEGRTELSVTMASAIEAGWLNDAFPHLVQRRLAHRYDATKERVMTVEQVLYVDLVLRERPVGNDADRSGAEHTLYEALRQDLEHLLAEDDAAEQWLARVRFLRTALPELDLPVFGRAEVEAALRAACNGRVSRKEVLVGGLRKHLERLLNAKQRQALHTQAPESILVPSGSCIRLHYPESGPPVLKVRLQELFGLGETPRIASGRVQVLLHLLGPNFRPVQVTTDLHSFWNNTYPQIRKELRARYPKHSWPEDPWTAPPATGPKRTPKRPR